MSKNNSFFKPTLLYKEFMTLDLIEKNNNITQRHISKTIGVAVSMVNNYLDELEKLGFVEREHFTTKTVKYHITKKGVERKKILNMDYFNSAQLIYNSAKENIEYFLDQIVKKNFKNILLYGAGEVAEILLQSILTKNNNTIEVICVIDDDINKQGKTLLNTPIVSIDNIDVIEHDGILVSSYNNRFQITSKLILKNYPKEKIINFFDL